MTGLQAMMLRMFVGEHIHGEDSEMCKEISKVVGVPVFEYGMAREHVNAKLELWCTFEDKSGERLTATKWFSAIPTFREMEDFFCKIEVGARAGSVVVKRDKIDWLCFLGSV